MNTEETFNEKQGHWMLAKLGKRVLRPGGIELTKVLMESMEIGPEDDVVELAPGLGLTASIACLQNPRTYTGVDRNEQAVAAAKKHIHFDRANMVIGDAAKTGLPDNYASKVYGEAMLTMHPIVIKQEIIQEAARILKPGGYYGIHELCVQPDDISDIDKKKIFKDLGANMRVHAHPLTLTEWKKLLEAVGFNVIKTATSPMALLELKRMIQDEGLGRTLKIILKVLTHAKIRRRVLHIREMFRRHANDIEAVAIIAQKK